MVSADLCGTVVKNKIKTYTAATVNRTTRIIVLCILYSTLYTAIEKKDDFEGCLKGVDGCFKGV